MIKDTISDKEYIALKGVIPSSINPELFFVPSDSLIPHLTEEDAVKIGRHFGVIRTEEEIAEMQRIVDSFNMEPLQNPCVPLRVHSEEWGGIVDFVTEMRVFIERGDGVFCKLKPIWEFMNRNNDA